jgi:hypothetical protein
MAELDWSLDPRLANNTLPVRELMNEPRRHRTSLNSDTRPRVSMLQDRLHNVPRRGNALTAPSSTSFHINNAERRGLL